MLIRKYSPAPIPATINEFSKAIRRSPAPFLLLAFLEIPEINLKEKRCGAKPPIGSGRCNSNEVTKDRCGVKTFYWSIYTTKSEPILNAINCLPRPARRLGHNSKSTLKINENRLIYW
jgi:hypothetical protein